MCYFLCLSQHDEELPQLPLQQDTYYFDNNDNNNIPTNYEDSVRMPHLERKEILRMYSPYKPKLWDAPKKKSSPTSFDEDDEELQHVRKCLVFMSHLDSLQ